MPMRCCCVYAVWSACWEDGGRSGRGVELNVCCTMSCSRFVMGVGILDSSRCWRKDAMQDVQVFETVGLLHWNMCSCVSSGSPQHGHMGSCSISPF